jgi:hypothetical protein
LFFLLVTLQVRNWFKLFNDLGAPSFGTGVVRGLYHDSIAADEREGERKAILQADEKLNSLTRCAIES